MTNPRETRTLASDSAPGVGDGLKGANAPPVNSKPGGRRTVFMIVGAALVLLAIVFLARPQHAEDQQARVIGPAQTSSEIADSTVPGAATPTQPTQR